MKVWDGIKEFRGWRWGEFEDESRSNLTIRRVSYLKEFLGGNTWYKEFMRFESCGRF